MLASFWLLLAAAAGYVYPPLYTSFLPASLKHGFLHVGVVLQKQWENLLDATTDDTYTLFTYGTWLVVLTTYLGGACIYTIMDLTLWPNSVRKYKNQPGENEPLDFKKLLRSLPLIAFNLISALPMSMLSWGYMDYEAIPPVRVLPDFRSAMFQFLGCWVVEEVGFYYTHRLLHHRWFYKRIHKIHHEWSAPVSVVAIYSHPIENILSNQVPMALGVLLTGAHLSITWLYLMSFLFKTLADHGGYHFPFTMSQEQHDYHHLKFRSCYGVLGWLDWLHGTDIKFQNSDQGKRDRTLWDLRSARELWPDSNSRIPKKIS